MKFKIFLLSIIILATCSSVSALSLSSADFFFPSYGLATHDFGDQEWMGPDATSYDAIWFGVFGPSINPLFLNVSVDNFFDVGANEWLSVWIDWDQSRIFDESERVVDLRDYWFDNGVTPLAFNIDGPTFPVYGETWMRARISFDGFLTPDGSYLTGEVEDYRVNVVPEPASMILLGLGLTGMAGYRKLRKRFGS